MRDANRRRNRYLREFPYRKRSRSACTLVFFRSIKSPLRIGARDSRRVKFRETAQNAAEVLLPSVPTRRLNRVTSIYNIQNRYRQVAEGGKQPICNQRFAMRALFTPREECCSGSCSLPLSHANRSLLSFRSVYVSTVFLVLHCETTNVPMCRGVQFSAR